MLTPLGAGPEPSHRYAPKGCVKVGWISGLVVLRSLQEGSTRGRYKGSMLWTMGPDMPKTAGVKSAHSCGNGYIP